ncbi:hypothetical protein ABZ446_14815 [Streptomyces sp. NPDC005813]|uniref:hypothetical protein n=1 Tax=Streptomyces sp. NPDC005813 TaxID=3155592 RepID=UPI0033C4389D
MQDLIDVYGRPLLQFVLNLPDGFEQPSLSPAQLEVAQILRDLCTQTADQDENVRWLNLGSMLTGYLSEVETSPAIYFRSQCGGDTEIYSTETDAIGKSLQLFARDVYAGFLVKRPMKEWYFGFHSAHYQSANPDYLSFCNSLLRDPRLKFLFPGDMDVTAADSFTDLIAVQSMFYTSSGSGGGLQLVSFLDNLLRVAHARCSLSGDTSLTGFLRAALDVLEEMRELAAGRTISVPVVIGLANVEFVDVDQLSLGQGELRKVREGDSKYIPRADTTDALLAFEVPFKLLSKTKVPDDDSFPDFSHHLPHVEKWRNGLQEIVNRSLLAIMLASPSGHRSAALVISQSVFDPMSVVPRMSWQEHTPATIAEKVSITQSEAEQIHSWADRVLREHPKNLGVAMRRIISSVGTRVDPVDGLVDAVLAWENMFSGTPETTLRVCGSLALLLEPKNFSAREVLFAELGAIYSTRSDIVHGKANEPSTVQVLQQRARAVEIAVQAMRRLYEFPDLLKAENSSVRGKKIMLGRVLNVDDDSNVRCE